MNDTAKSLVMELFVRDPVAAIAMHVLVQATGFLGLGLLASRLWKRNPAVRFVALTAAMIAALGAPLIAVAANRGGFAWWRLSSAPASATISPGELRDQANLGAASAVVAPVVNGEKEAIVRVSPAAEAIELSRSKASAQRQVDDMSDDVHDDKDHRPRYSRTVRILAAVWGIGSLVCLAGLVRGWVKLRRIVRRASEIKSSRMESAWSDARRILGIRSCPRICSSREIASPAAVGVWRPAILLPAGYCNDLTDCELRAVLLHEGAHLVRRDPCLLLCQRIFEAMFWAHPLMLVFRRELSRAREEACDNYVLQWHDGPSYGQTLLRLALLAAPGPRLTDPGLAVGLFCSRWRLEERIAGFLNDRRKTMIRVNAWTTLAIVLATGSGAFVVGGARVAAQSDGAVAAPLSSATKDIDASSTVEAAPSPKVVATVNGQPITTDQLGEAALADGGDQTLDGLIRRRVIEYACRDQHVTVTEGEIVAEAERTAAKFDLTLDEWYRLLKQERGMGSDAYRRDVIWPSLALMKLANAKETPADVMRRLMSAVEVEKTAETLEADKVSKPQSAGGIESQPAATVPAPAPQLANGSPRIAFANMHRIFKASARFERHSSALKDEVARAEEKFSTLRREIVVLQDVLKLIDLDNAAGRAELEKLIAEKKTKVEQDIEPARKNMLEQEKEIYLEVYQEICSAIQKYAEEQGIDLVLRIQDSPAPPEASGADQRDALDAKDVLAKINQHVLYNRRDAGDKWDITDAIIERLNAQNEKDSLP